MTTLGDSLTSGKVFSLPGVAGSSSNPTANGMINQAGQQHLPQQQQSTQQGAAQMTNQGPPGINPNPVVLKVKDEILTSRHLIKDIRRLETYQREFFLKVKESLNHVQALLDHQLMDMAWSDTLINCEESLLQASVLLGSSSPAQITEIYAMMIQDREKLTQRFQDLSVKSSLSEYVVNSPTLLDIDTVHMATEAILRNEKPPPPKPGKIPVDHTFFLANFCTTSIASSMFASFMPKRTDSSIGGSAANSNAVNHSSNQSQKMMLAQQQQQSPQQQQSVEKYFRSGNPSGDLQAPSGMPPISNGLYNGGDGNMEKYMNVRSVSSNVGNVKDKDLGGSNVMGGHELVAAISQITQREDASSPNRSRGNDMWAKDSKKISTASGQRRVHPQDDQTALGPVRRQSGGPSGSSTNPNANPASGFMGQNGFSADEPSSSEQMPSESDAPDFDSSKPLSFARIASLNLEKQAMARRQQMLQQQQQGQQPVMVNNGKSMMLARGSPMGPQDQSQQQQSAIQPNQGNSSESNLMSIPMVQLPPSNNPRYFFDIAMEGKRVGRVIIEVQPSIAPKMAQNFGMLVTGEKGFGYKGCNFFQVWKNESVICGDWEHNSGRGGKAALDGGSLFTPDETRLPCIRGAVGMRRMSKKHSSLNQVASQFRIILANMNTQFTGIFGHVVYGIETMDKVADIGGEGGRPEKIASVAACGIYKP